MIFSKKDNEKHKAGSEGFFSGLPFFQKKESAWDDGTDVSLPDSEQIERAKIVGIMSFYGGLSGFFASQYCKYLHQLFVCRAWGIALTSRRVKSYGVPSLVADVIATFVVYVLVCAVGLLLDRVLKYAWDGKDVNMYNEALGYGFFLLIVVSLIMLILPFNVFLIGIP